MQRLHYASSVLRPPCGFAESQSVFRSGVSGRIWLNRLHDQRCDLKSAETGRVRRLARKLMDKQEPLAASENRLREPESLPVPSRLLPGARVGGSRQARPSATEPKRVEIVVRIAPAQ